MHRVPVELGDVTQALVEHANQFDGTAGRRDQFAVVLGSAPASCSVLPSPYSSRYAGLAACSRFTDAKMRF